MGSRLSVNSATHAINIIKPKKNQPQGHYRATHQTNTIKGAKDVLLSRQTGGKKGSKSPIKAEAKMRTVDPLPHLLKT